VLCSSGLSDSGESEKNCMIFIIELHVSLN